MNSVLVCNRVVLHGGSVRGRLRAWFGLGCLLTACLSSQCVQVLVVVALHPLVFCDLTFEVRLVGALVEPLDAPMLKLTLFWTYN
jgi:hypothetical protein